MYRKMHSKSYFRGEPLLAHLALVIFFTGMNVEVLVKITLVPESFLTNWALVRLLTCVDAVVYLKALFSRHFHKAN